MGYHAPLLSGRRPNRVIDIACFDSKLQQARNTCERKQAKRRDWNVLNASANVCHANVSYKVRGMREFQKLI